MFLCDDGEGPSEIHNLKSTWHSPFLLAYMGPLLIHIFWLVRGVV